MRLVSIVFLVIGVVTGLAIAGFAGERDVTDVKELAGTWRGWVTATSPSLSTMTIKEDGSYRAASEDKGKVYLLVIPDNTDSMGLAGSTGKTEYERVK
jgi:hypothetical protein